MTTYFVSRHSALIDWAEQEGLLQNTQVISHLQVENVRMGDVVIGALPIDLAMRINERGGRYRHITLDGGLDLHGRELTPALLRERNIRLEELAIQHAPVTHVRMARTVHICLVSEDPQPNLLAACVSSLRADRCLLLTDDSMQRRGADQKLRFALEQGGCHNVEILEGLPSHDIADIISWGRRLAQRLFEVEPTPRYVLNLTGGNKLVSLGMLQAFMPRCEIIYCDTQHGQIEFLHPPVRPPLPLASRHASLDTLIAAYGLRAIRSTVDVAALEERRALSLWLASHIGQLGDLMQRLIAAAADRLRDRRLPQPASPRPHESGAIERMLLAGVLVRGSASMEIAHSGCDYLQGNWLREYCWLVTDMLVSRKLLDPAYIAFSVSLQPFSMLAGGGLATDQADALIAHDNRLLVVQCQSGPLRDENEFVQDVLARFELFPCRDTPSHCNLSRLLLTTVDHLPTSTVEHFARAHIEVLNATALDKLGDWLLRWLKSGCN